MCSQTWITIHMFLLEKLFSLCMFGGWWGNRNQWRFNWVRLSLNRSSNSWCSIWIIWIQWFYTQWSCTDPSWFYSLVRHEWAWRHFGNGWRTIWTQWFYTKGSCSSSPTWVFPLVGFERNGWNIWIILNTCFSFSYSEVYFLTQYKKNIWAKENIIIQNNDMYLWRRRSRSSSSSVSTWFIKVAPETDCAERRASCLARTICNCSFSSMAWKTTFSSLRDRWS